ncbi:hypothetical protein DLM75_17360 [Leptospira stimsonii]|uniref:Uncharacterized protein n=1 Tax=Leptospira stimsonii TaxID=2202203 RepID=A0A396YZH3_9LEPT|nr:hypothetical protein DLM75_17360 [Leptospira stimsonii]
MKGKFFVKSVKSRNSYFYKGKTTRRLNHLVKWELTLSVLLEKKGILFLRAFSKVLSCSRKTFYKRSKNDSKSLKCGNSPLSSEKESALIHSVGTTTHREKRRAPP